MNTQNTQAAQPTNVDRINGIISEYLGIAPADIKSDAKIVDDLGADSLDTVEMIMALEDEFEFEISDEDAEQWKIVQDIYNYINAKLK